MPTAKELLNKHKNRLPSKKVERKGMTRPWQENLEKEAKEKLDKNSSINRVGANALSEKDKQLANSTEGQGASNPVKADITKDLKVENSVVKVSEKAKNKVLRSSIEGKRQGVSFLECEEIVNQYGAEKSMYVVLLMSLADDEMNISAAQNKIASLFSVSDRSVKRILKMLVSSNILEIVSDYDPKTKDSRVYRLNI